MKFVAIGEDGEFRRNPKQTADRRVTDFWSVRTSGEPLRKDFGGWNRFLGIASNAIIAYCPPPLISSPTQGPSEPHQLFLSPK